MATGLALAVAPLTSTILASVDAQHTGMVSGLNSALSRLGGLIAVALMGAVLGASGQQLLDGYAVAMVVTAIVAALGAAAAFVGLVPSRSRR